MRRVPSPLLVLAFLATPPVFAQGSPAHCASLGETAAKVMEARQLDIPEDQLMALASDGAAAQSLTWIAREAYEEPVYPSEAQKQGAMAEFARAIEAACLAG